jgi:histone acetyltransferase (RNA polymerase elongator complex component)
MIPKRCIIPIFVPHLGCPNACVFCNQRKISGSLVPARAAEERAALEAARERAQGGAELAFYGGSFTAIEPERQLELLEAARPWLEEGFLESIRVSTRPDAVDRAALELLASRGVRTVELGAQSMDEAVLAASNRGHGAADTERAARLVKEAGLKLVLQMMTGLPASSPASDLETAERLAALAPDGVRIYPTVIIRDSALCELWKRGLYREHTVAEAVEVCSRIVPVFEAAGIPVIRLGLNPTEELSGGEAAGGAYHPALGQLVYSRLYLDKARSLLRGLPKARRVALGVHPSCVSLMAGHRRENLEALRAEFGLERIAVRGAETAPGGIEILEII